MHFSEIPRRDVRTADGSRVNKRPIVDGPSAGLRRLGLRQFFQARRRRLLTHGPAGLLVGVHTDPELARRVPHRKMRHLGEAGRREPHRPASQPRPAPGRPSRRAPGCARTGRDSRSTRLRSNCGIGRNSTTWDWSSPRNGRTAVESTALWGIHSNSTTWDSVNSPVLLRPPRSSPSRCTCQREIEMSPFLAK